MSSSRRAVPPADALAFFGATGDLAYKKIFPALYSLFRKGRLEIPVVGVAFSRWDVDQLRERARDSLRTHGGIEDEAEAERFLGRLRYVDGDYADAATFAELKRVLGDSARPAHYLAIPPSLFERVVLGLQASGCATGARVVVEKPFGRDLRSARELNDVLRGVFAEDAVFRIDHFLGKEAIENILYFRFANSFPEAFWNRTHVTSVQVTMAESFGVQGRGSFYESTGCLRDVIENHLFQIVSLLAMEPPVGHGHEGLQDEKAKVFKAMRPLAKEDLIRGQFTGYRQEPGVAPDSDVETYAAVKLYIDSWRWEGVPFYLRSGKSLAATVTEVLVQLKTPPLQVFGESRPARGKGNYVRFRIAPSAAIALAARIKLPGDEFVGEQAEMYLCNVHDGEPDAYERLLGDALAGNSTLFTREDAVEAAWAVVDPVLRDHDSSIAYEPGSWGPAAADRMTAADGGWHEPVPESPPLPR